MEQELKNLQREVFLLQQDRMRIINEDSLHFKAIEADLKLYSAKLLLLTDIINDLQVEIERNKNAQVLLNRQFALKVEVKPEVKLKKLFNWFGRK